MADQLHGQGVNAGAALQLGRGERGQLAVVAVREVPADFPDLGGHEMEIVEKPLRGGRDEFAPMDVVGERTIGVAQEPRVLVEAREHAARGAARRIDGEARGERAGALLQELDAQQLVAEGFRRIGRAPGAHLTAPGPSSAPAGWSRAPAGARSPSPRL